MSVHVRFKNVSIYTGSRNGMVFTHDSLGFINRTAAECHSPVAVSGSDGSAYRVALTWERPAKTVVPLFHKGILLHGARRRQSTSWLCYCHIKISREKAGNHQATGNRRMWVASLESSSVGRAVDF